MDASRLETVDAAGELAACKELGFALVRDVDLQPILGRPAQQALAALAGHPKVLNCNATSGPGRRLDKVLKGEERAYRLAREARSQVYTLKASRFIQQAELVLVYAGKVWEADQWNLSLPDGVEDSQQLWAFDVPARTLKESFGYAGPGLVVEGSTKCSQGRLLQDASWWDGDEDGNNLQAQLLLAKHGEGDTPKPYVAFFATRPILSGQELLLSCEHAQCVLHARRAGARLLSAVNCRRRVKAFIPARAPPFLMPRPNAPLLPTLVITCPVCLCLGMPVDVATQSVG